MTATDMTTTYGMPCAKYKLGTHHQGRCSDWPAASDGASVVISYLRCSISARADSPSRPSLEMAETKIVFGCSAPSSFKVCSFSLPGTIAVFQPSPLCDLTNHCHGGLPCRNFIRTAMS